MRFIVFKFHALDTTLQVESMCVIVWDVDFGSKALCVVGFF
jgi:hypothetical protein